MPTSRTLSIYEPIKEELSLVRSDLIAISEEDFPGLAAMLAHALKSIGKGTRPAITILSSKFHDHDPALPRLMACAVELLHIATLVHDDTIDKAALRRGQPTISNLWGDHAAVLVGDYLFAKSATFVCATENVRVIRLFSETIMYLSRGELQERLGAFDWTTGRDDYYQRIQQKTASLFTTAAESGAILSGAPEETVQRFHTFGHCLGMAFQIVDDILDFQGTSEETGKPVGSDLAHGVMTLPTIIALERRGNGNPVAQYCQQPDDGVLLEQAVDFIRQPDIIEEAYGVADDFSRKALQALEPIPRTTERDSLADLVPLIARRRI
jgi:geranylgeranyl pyrophosphate synthase